MELWIISQDKEDFLEVHNLGLAYKGKYGFMDKIGDIDGYCICEFINDYHVKLGTYTTKERALEVLDDIKRKMLKGTFAEKKNGLGETLDFMPNPIYVYEMPID